jgi:UDP-4-amino-4,6-dideoxy-N-acetyl-beta-L-altrosamine N-acetyltransferase
MWIFKNYHLLSDTEHKELLHVRNEPQIRQASKNSSKINLNDHLQWLKTLGEDRYYFALFIDDKIVGGLNATYSDSSVTNWGIFFSKNTKPLISSMATYIFIEKMFQKADILYSEVNRSNTQAIKFNKFFAIEIYDEDNQYYKLRLTKEVWREKSTSLGIIRKRLKSVEYKFLGDL